MSLLVDIGIAIGTGVLTGAGTSYLVSKKFSEKAEKQEIYGVLQKITWDSNTLHVMLEEDKKNPRTTLRDSIETTVYSLLAAIRNFSSMERYSKLITDDGNRLMNEYHNLLVRLMNVYSANNRLTASKTDEELKKITSYKLGILNEADMLIGKIHKNNLTKDFII